jgi:hypothetical protein
MATFENDNMQAQNVTQALRTPAPTFLSGAPIQKIACTFDMASI